MKRAVLAIALLLTLFLGMSAAWRAWHRPAEPYYQGRKLTLWVQDYLQSSNLVASRAALTAMGPEAARFLLDQITRQSTTPVLRESYRTWYRGLSYTLRRKFPSPGKTPNTQLRETARVLCLVAPQAPDILLQAATSPEDDVRFVVALTLRCLPPDVSEVVPVMSRLTLDSSAPVRSEALRSLLLTQADKTPALPTLLQVIQENESTASAPLLSMATVALAEIGPAAAEAVPNLERFLESSNISLRVHAAVALWSIDRNTNGIPCFIRELKSTNAINPILRMTLQTLAAMGVEARSTVPAILWQFTNTTVRPETRHLRGEAIRTLEALDPPAAARLRQHLGTL